MNNLNNSYTFETGIETGFSRYLSKTFLTMAIGLFISFFTGYLISNNIETIVRTFGSGFVNFMWVLIVVEIAISWMMLGLVSKLNVTVLSLMYGFYCILTGATLGILMLVYGAQNAYFAFFITTVMFGSMAFIGYTCKKDLSRFSSLFTIGLITIIISTVVGLFIDSNLFDLIITFAGIVLFLGIVAYDTQKIKSYYYHFENDKSLQNKYVIIGAFGLYLDFINLFIRILRILGSRGSKK